VSGMWVFAVQQMRSADKEQSLLRLQ